MRQPHSSQPPLVLLLPARCIAPLQCSVLSEAARSGGPAGGRLEGLDQCASGCLVAGCTTRTLLYLCHVGQCVPVLHLQSEKKVSVKCGTFGATNLHQRHLATGDFDGKLNVWSVHGSDL